MRAPGRRAPRSPAPGSVEIPLFLEGSNVSRGDRDGHGCRVPPPHGVALLVESSTRGGTCDLRGLLLVSAARSHQPRKPEAFLLFLAVIARRLIVLLRVVLLGLVATVRAATAGETRRPLFNSRHGAKWYGLVGEVIL